MPHYFFDLTDARQSTISKENSCAILEAAREHAIAIACAKKNPAEAGLVSSL
jgi:hypothetical protein